MSNTSGAGTTNCSTAIGTNNHYFWASDTVPKRAAGSVVTAGTWGWNSNANGTGDFTSFGLRYQNGKTSVECAGVVTAGSVGTIGYVFPRGGSAILAVNAEL
jgi:hypothetical protein